MNTVRRWSRLPLVLTAKEAAEIIGITPYTMGQHLIRGDIPGQRVGRSWRVSRDALRNYLEGNNNERNEEERRGAV